MYRIPHPGITAITSYPCERLFRLCSFEFEYHTHYIYIYKLDYLQILPVMNIVVRTMENSLRHSASEKHAILWFLFIVVYWVVLWNVILINKKS